MQFRHMPRAAVFATAFISGVAAAQGVSPQLIGGWQREIVSRQGLPSVEVYQFHDSTRKPVVVALQGSGCSPLVTIREVEVTQNGVRRKARSLATTIGAVGLTLPKGGALPFHLVLVEKRGVTSFVTADSGADQGPRTVCNAAYRAAATMSERVRDVADAIKAVARQPWAGDILVLGESEGAQVAAQVAGQNPSLVRAVALVSGAGVNQFFSLVTEARRTEGAAGAQRMLTDMDRIARGVQTDDYLGHSVERWRSFAVQTSPLDALRGVDVPVLVAQGDRDANAAVEGADAFVTELLRAPSRKVFYLMLPGRDHGLSEVGTAGESVISDVYRLFVQWSRNPVRGVVVGLAAAQDIVRTM